MWEFIFPLRTHMPFRGPFLGFVIFDRQCYQLRFKGAQEEWKPSPFLRASDHPGLRNRSSTDRRPRDVWGRGPAAPGPRGSRSRLDSAFSYPCTPQLPHRQVPSQGAWLAFAPLGEPLRSASSAHTQRHSTGPSSYSVTIGGPTPLCDVHGLPFSKGDTRPRHRPGQQSRQPAGQFTYSLISWC